MGLGYRKKYAPLDALTKFAEDLTLTASDVVQMDTVDRIIDLVGGSHDFLLVVDVTALDIASNDELYTFLVQGCAEEDFSGSPIENVAMLQLGATEVRLGGALDSVVGRRVIPISNYTVAEYRFLRLNVLIGGTSPSITFSAWISRPVTV